MKNLSKIQQIIFISKNAVRYFFIGLQKAKISLPNSILITCIGPGTEKTLNTFNYGADFIPKTHDSEHLLELANFTNVAKKNIILVKGVGGRKNIGETLKARGANLINVDVYTRHLPIINPEVIETLWKEDGIDMIVYTSKQAMLNSFMLFPNSAKTWLLSKSCIVISERLAKHAATFGFQNIIKTSYTAIINVIKEHNT